MSDFKVGHRMVTLDPINGPWCRSDSPMGAFIDCWSFLGWVMRGCPPVGKGDPPSRGESHDRPTR